MPSGSVPGVAAHAYRARLRGLVLGVECGLAAHMNFGGRARPRNTSPQLAAGGLLYYYACRLRRIGTGLFQQLRPSTCLISSVKPVWYWRHFLRGHGTVCA